MTDIPDFAKACRPLRHSVSRGASCRGDFRERLELAVTEFLGTSAEVNVGEKYIIRGRYRLTGQDAVSLGAVISGRSRGRWVELAPGSGSFAVWTEVLEVPEGPSRHIGLMVGTTDDNECGGTHSGIRITE